MDGLECREIWLSQVQEYNFFRIDSHFFEKKYKNLKNVFSNHSCYMLKDLVSKDIQTGHTPSMSNAAFYGGSIALIKTDNLHDNSIGTSFSDYLSEKGNATIARTTLARGDIITTIIGATEKIIARSAMITEEYLPANINQNIVQIRIDPTKAYPEYINTYLNTKYGKGYLIYLSRQTEQFNLNCKEIESVLVPIFSEPFQKKISEIVQEAQKIQETSRSSYKEGEDILASIYTMQKIEQSASTFAAKFFSESFMQTGRFDAEYYQPQYDLIAHDLNTTDTVLSLCNIYDSNYLPQQDKEYQYIELANVGYGGDISGIESIVGKELPSRARRRVSEGQIIVSSVEGSLQSCALISDEYDGALCSTGFYVIDSNTINPETLLVLFKSKPIQSLMKQRCSGTILTAISKDELLSMPFPKIKKEVQDTIAIKVQESFSFRRRSRELLEFAKQAVEMAIEQGEGIALDWLGDSVGL